MQNHVSLLAQNSTDYVYGKGTLSPLLHHPLSLAYVNLIMIKKGQVHLSIQFQDYVAKAGDILILSEDSLTILKDQSEDFLCEFYLLNRRFAAEVAQPLPLSLFSYLSRTPHFSLNSEQMHLLKSWQTQGLFILTKTQQYQRILLCNHLQNFLFALAEIVGDKQPLPLNEHNRQEELCWQFWAMVAQHSQKERGVAFYAKKLHISPYYLAQLCQRYFNDSPKTLIDRQVILQLKQYLKTTNLSIQSISDQMHFPDTSYMNRYFKKHTGTSLSHYRKALG